MEVRDDQQDRDVYKACLGIEVVGCQEEAKQGQGHREIQPGIPALKKSVIEVCLNGLREILTTSMDDYENNPCLDNHTYLTVSLQQFLTIQLGRRTNDVAHLTWEQFLKALKTAKEFDVLWDVLFKDQPKAVELASKFWNILFPGKNSNLNRYSLEKQKCWQSKLFTR